jgi:predicted AlkP superfamily phosphohydrolase/phosphomutase
MLLVIGVDGATFDLLDNWILSGDLPNLAYLIKNGTRANLESTLPPITAPAWASFITGKNPQKHGVFDFFKPGIYPLQMVNSSDIRSPFFWDYLTAAGIKAGILNLPVTFPPRPLNGFLIPGLLSPDQGRTTYPPSLLEPYSSKLGSYQLTPQTLYWPGSEMSYLAELMSVTDVQIAYALHLIQDHKPDIAVIHFLATDIAQHKLWKHLDADHPWHNPTLATEVVMEVKRLFGRIDQAIGQLRTNAGEDTTVLILSDHGFGPMWRTVNLNNWFKEHGLLELRRDLRVRLRHWLAEHPFLAAVTRRLLRSTTTKELLRMDDIDWGKTSAFSMGHCGQVYINRQGAFPQGSVSPDEISVVRDQVLRCLRGLKDPDTGEAVVDHIIPAQESLDGSNLFSGPDFHIIMDGYRAVAHPLFAADGKIITELPQGDSGFHRPDGVFIAHGPSIRVGSQLNQARIIDLAPTILHLLGVPVPEDMDGVVLEDVLTTAFHRAHPQKYQKPLQYDGLGAQQKAEEQSEVEERLRALGYLG